jgi:beta-glucosidase
VGLDAERRLVAGAAPPEPFDLELVRDGVAEAAAIAGRAETALVFVGNHPLLVAKEEIDREDIGLAPAQERLIGAVVAANPRTVVVVVGSYPFALGPWKDRVAAVLYTAHGGQEAGNAIAEVLLGACNPAGRLPMTWYRSLDQIGGIMDYDIARGKRTYRHFEGEPLYPFGYGLSYSRFAYSWAGGEAAAESDGRGGFSVGLRIENRSDRDGDEVPQLYISCKGSALSRPRRQLADFRRISVPAGAATELRLRVPAEDFDHWDEAGRSWVREAAEWELQVGASSADLRLALPLRVEGRKLP